MKFICFVNGTFKDCNALDGHAVDNTRLLNGILRLTVNYSEVLQVNSYKCIAVYEDGSTAESRDLKLPPYEG